jgi:hypothetical protein
MLVAFIIIIIIIIMADHKICSDLTGIFVVVVFPSSLWAFDVSMSDGFIFNCFAG